MPSKIPNTHPAVVITKPRAPLAIVERPTVAPGAGEVIVHVEWTSSTPLDLHQADGGLLIQPMAVMGSSFAGTVVQRGPPPPQGTPAYATQDVREGEKVFGFAWRIPVEKCHQTFITVPTYLMSRLPAKLAPQEAVTVPTNLVTAIHTITADLGLALPWPLAGSWVPPDPLRDSPILVWGASSSVGLYAVQVLRHWRYRNVLAVAGAKHHAALERSGAAACFDYRMPDVVDRIMEHVGTVAARGGPRVPLILDCIGSLEGTLEPLARIAEAGTKVAVMLPVIVKDATKENAPEYEMDVTKCLVGQWKEGVVLSGVRITNLRVGHGINFHIAS